MFPDSPLAASISEFLNQMSEKDIAKLFDSLKEKYGRDIFGQGYIYKIVEEDELADVSKLTKDEKKMVSTPRKSLRALR